MRRSNILRSTDVPAACIVERGEAFLPDVDMADIESLHAGGTDYKVKCVLQAIRLRKQRNSFRQISKALGAAKSTVYGWLLRLAVGGIERMHDRKSPGRPCRLSVKQKNRLRRDLGKSPAGCGFLRGSWTAKILTCHIKNRFKVAYGASDALQLTKKIGFSVRYARPVPYNCATPEKQDEYVCETMKMLKKYDGKHYKADVWTPQPLWMRPHLHEADGQGAERTRSRLIFQI